MAIHKKNPKIMFGLWCTAYIVFSISSSVYMSYQEVINGIDCTVLGGEFQLTTLLIVLLGFLPALYRIYRITKQSPSPKLEKVVGRLLIILSIWTGAMIFSFVTEWIAHGIV